MSLENILVDLIKYPIKQYVVSPISRHLTYPFKCDSKVETLENEVEQLKNERNRLKQSVDQARRNGEEIHDNVTEWLISADKAIGEAEELVQLKEQAKKKFFFGYLPNLKTRSQLSKRADKKASEVIKMRKKEGLEPVSFVSIPQQIVEPSLYSREALLSRVFMLNQIVDALKDPNLNMIGVYGMGGVGKTTLAKEVHGQALKLKLFDAVVMVGISQTPELRRIQGEIADMIGMKFDVEGVPGRASRLHQRLSNSKVLIILDDLWHKLELNAIGIPSGDACAGCKMLLFSRRKDVLSNEMGTQKEFQLDVLREEEAWSLFQTTVAKAKVPKLPNVAREVAIKCAGLPLLILKVAMDLRNKESYAWNDMLHRLSRPDDEDIYDKVHCVIHSSYENLGDVKAKSIFLLCSLFGQSSIRIDSLVAYYKALYLFQLNSIEKARERVLTLIDKLKDECLLLDDDMVGFVKIHDVVRDTALTIASREQRTFVGAGKVRSTDLQNKDYTRISLPYCDIGELPEVLKCPEVELFLLFTGDRSIEIPDSFFERITKLKVVDFTGVRFASRLPSSLALLANLHSLSLSGCQLDDVAIVGNLKQLEFLSFGYSKIVELSREIGGLTRLKLLDLRNCSKLQVIPANVISKLCLLEELYMLNSFVGWDAKGNVSLEELENLSHLSTLEIQIVNPKLIPRRCRFFDRLQSYKISIGDKWDWNGKYETRRTLKLKLEPGIRSENEIEVLLRGIEDLYLDEVSGMDQSLLYSLDPQLKHLHIHNADGIQHLIKSTMLGSCHAFPMLESLFLENMNSLEQICLCQLADGSFSKLKTVQVRKCNKLKNLFSFSSAKCLPQLQELEVDFCEEMEAIVSEGSADDNYSNNEVIEFTQLSSLTLRNLPNLRGFCKREDTTEQMKLLFNELVSFPNLTSLVVNRCKSLKYVFTASTVRCLLQLKKVEISGCELVEEIIQRNRHGEMEEESMGNEIVFWKLDSLSLIGLPKVENFGYGYSIKFPLLRELRIKDCSEMKNFVSRFSGQSNISNKSDECLFNNKLSFSNLEKMEITQMHKLRYLWKEQFADDDSFSRLKSLRIEDCNVLSVVFPSNVYRRFKRLETLGLQCCNRVEKIYEHQEGDEQAPKQAFALRHLQISNLSSLKHIWSTSTDAFGVFDFGNLQSVDVDSCKDLRYLFPVSIACGLSHLQQLKISWCSMEVIIADGEPQVSTPYFQFPHLTFLRLENSNELKGLYERTHTSEWPKLKYLEVYGCDKLMVFWCRPYQRQYWEGAHSFSRHQSLFSIDKGRYQEGQHSFSRQEPLFSVEKLSLSLVELTMDDQGLEELAIYQRQMHAVNFFPKVKKVTLTSSKDRYIPSLFGFLTKLGSLEKLVLVQSSLRDIFFLDGQILEGSSDDQRAKKKEEHHHVPTILKLEHLELSYVGNLKHILMEDSQLNCTLHYLQTLNISLCDDLMNIAPSSASFGNLTTLNVESCRRTENLVTASTAKTMVQLVELRICNCKTMKEIVANNGEHDEITFHRLKRLELVDLVALNSFCFGDYTFNFPLLEQVIVHGCNEMKLFCGGDLNTPELWGVQFQDEQDKWEGNLNATITLYHITKTLSAELEELTIDEILLKAIQISGEFAVGFFTKLRKVTWSSSEDGLIPSLFGFLRRLYSFEELCFQQCSCKEIFSVYNEGEQKYHPRLKHLKLHSVQFLKHILKKDSQLNPVFQNLQILNVESCNSLMNIAPSSASFRNLTALYVDKCATITNLVRASTARTMVQLVELTVSRCEMIEEIIVAGDRDCTEHEEIVFNKLKHLKLESLPKLNSFCSGNCTFRFSLLEQVIVDRCPKMNNFCDGVLTTPELRGILFEDKQQWKGNLNATIALCLLRKRLSPSSKELTIHGEDLKAIHHSGDFLVQFSTELEKVTFKSFDEKSIPSLFGLLRQVSPLETLVLIYVSLEEILIVDDQRAIGMKGHHVFAVKHLELKHIRNVRHIMKEDSKPNITAFGLQTLNVTRCDDLMNIAPSSAHFDNLTTLKVEWCKKMTSLVTVSVAKTMVQLRELKVSSCKIMGEIVKDDTNGKEHEVVFNKLRRLELHLLHSLDFFCSSSCTFSFPLLEEVLIESCSRMDIFCYGALNTPNLQGITYESNQRWEEDLNATIANGSLGMEEMEIGDRDLSAFNLNYKVAQVGLYGVNVVK